MSDIYISSTNRVMLEGKVVGKPAFRQNTKGRDICELSLQTDKFMMVGGKSQMVSLVHQVLITNRYSVPAFKANLREGDFIKLLGELGSANGKQLVIVTDFGHEASFLYVPATRSDETPAPKQANKGGAFDMGDLPGKPKGGSGDDDGFFRANAALDRRPPSKAPEGFEDSDIPF